MQALQGWEKLEDEAGRRLLVPSGLVSCGERVDELLESMREGGAQRGAPDRRGGERRFPGLCVTGRAVYESAAGVLLADEVLRALVECRHLRAPRAPRRHPDRRRRRRASRSKQSSIRPTTREASEAHFSRSGRARVPRAQGEEGERRTFGCRAAILCGGAWSSAIARMAGLDGSPGVLWASLQQVVYVSLPDGQARATAGGRLVRELRCLLRPADTRARAPTSSGCTTRGSRVDPARASLSDDPSDLALLADVRASLAARRTAEPVATERCFYDNCPGQDFVLDRVGRLVIAAGTSGHGFKFGPLIGEALADLAEEKVPAIPLERFSARRGPGRPDARGLAVRPHRLGAGTALDRLDGRRPDRAIGGVGHVSGTGIASRDCRRRGDAAGETAAVGPLE